MKTNGYVSITLLAAATLFGSSAYAQAQGPACTSATAAGTYAVTCSGFTNATASGPLVPTMQVGTVTGDADGNWSGSTTVNVAGQTIVTNARVSGKATVNSNCTGTITYNKGTANEINISFVVVPPAKEIHGVVTDKGSAVSCVLQRIAE